MTERLSSDQTERIREALGFLAANDESAALEIAQDVLRADPGRAEALFVLGLTAYRMGDVGRAIELFNRAHDLDPDCRDYADALAVLFTKVGKLADGLYFAKLATTLEGHPDLQPFVPAELSNYFHALRNTAPSGNYVSALVEFNRRRFEDARDACERELRINADHGPCVQLLGRCQHELDAFDEAETTLRHALALDPANALGHVYLGNALYRLGRFDHALACHRKALELDGDSVAVAAAAALGATVIDADGGDASRAARAELNRRIAAAAQEEDDDYGEPYVEPTDRIRVGYLCNAAFEGEVAVFFDSLLRNHDRGRFEIFGYQQSITEDSANIQLQNRADSWRRIYDLDDAVVATIVRGDGIDVLVDLCGVTEEQRCILMATAPAPVRAAWLGYPYGIDAPGINMVLGDAETADTDEAALAPGQTLMRLEPGLIALDPFIAMPDISPSPAADKGYVTFGGRCELTALTPGTAALWAQVLKAVPGSRLLLGNVREMCPAVRSHTIELFAREGVVDRVLFHDTSDEDRPDPAFFGRVDIFLDSAAVSGRLNLCHALWMGVPVLTLKGPDRITQTGASLLRSAGHPDWIGRSPDHLVETARDLAADIAALADLRRGLRDAVRESALFNPRLFARALEDAYARAVEEARRA